MQLAMRHPRRGEFPSDDCMCEKGFDATNVRDLEALRANAQLHESGGHVDDIVMSRDDSENAQFRLRAISLDAQFRLMR